MRDAYIIKNSVTRNPKVKISRDEFLDLVENSKKLTWLEDTVHGARRLKRQPERFKLKYRAYLNYDQDDEKSFVHLILSVDAYINVQFDYKSTNENLLDLLEMSKSIECNICLLYTSPSPRDATLSRMPSSA